MSSFAFARSHEVKAGTPAKASSKIHAPSIVAQLGMKHSQVPMLALDATPVDQASESFHEAIYGLDRPRSEGATLEYKKFGAASSKSELSGCSN